VTVQPSQGAAARFCAAVDRLNNFMGRVWGLTILFVTFAVLYEVVARGVFGQATLWANETTVYLSAMAYLIAGGYALQRRMHVRIDVVYLMFSPRGRVRADLFGFIFFFLYVMTLIWIGGDMAWTSLQQGETTGTPWNPPIWPVKAAIPLAGLLLLLQGIANIVRDLASTPSEAGSR
jgi:TRAP-type mannitol/chloroaromatic compound transport system permease small subunit